MLCHFLPQLFDAPEVGPLTPVRVLDFSCPKLGLHIDGSQLALRRPYPNKRYQVACRNVGRKACLGFFAEVPDQCMLPEFSTVTRWGLGERILVHKVNHLILDRELDAITWDPVIWGGLHEWPSRRPSMVPAEWAPSKYRPRMDVWAFEERQGFSIIDRAEDHLLVERTETLFLHTVERARVIGFWKRMPLLEHAFRVAGAVEEGQ